MKILLINPVFCEEYRLIKRGQLLVPPINLAYLAGGLERCGHEVEIVDANVLFLMLDDLREIIAASGADVVGVTAKTPTYNDALDVLGMTKEVLPAAVTVLGGPHPTVCPERCIIHDCCDFLVLGEGEITLTELVSVLESGGDPSAIEGLAFMQDGTMFKTPPRPLIENLDELPFPSYQLLPLEKYTLGPQQLVATGGSHTVPYMAMMTSRGCPHRCVFCSTYTVFGRHCRLRSPENVFEEITYLVEKLGVRRIDFMDDTFTIDRQRVVTLCRMIIETRLDIRWLCQTRVDRVDQELLTLMRSAGCDLILFGLESGSQQVLNRIKKGVTVEQAKNAVTWTKEAGIAIIGSFMVGNPGETRETIRETVDFARNTDIDSADFNLFTPYPGTDYFEDTYQDDNWRDFIDPEFNERVAFVPAGFTSEELALAQRIAYRRFYLRPWYVWRYHLLNLRRPGVWKYYLRALLALISRV